MRAIELEDKTLTRWVEAALAEGTWVPAEALATPPVAQLRASRSALTSFLSDEASPFDQAKPCVVSLRSHAGVDQLRCEYEAMGYAVTAVEGINFALVRVVRVAPIGSEESLSSRALATQVERVVRRERSAGAWSFALPDELPAEPLHVTSRGAPPVAKLETRDDRADILILEGVAHFVFFKKAPQLEDFQRDDGWFPEPLRAELRQHGAAP